LLDSLLQEKQSHTMFVCRLLRQDLRRPLTSLISARGVKSNRPSKTEIVDTELGTLHLSVDDDDDIFSTKSMDSNKPIDPPKSSTATKEYGQPMQEDLTPYGTRRPEEGAMERSVNTVTLVGRVGNDPLMRGSKERPVTVFSLATNTSWKSQGAAAGEEWSHRTDWHNIAVFKAGLRDTAYNYVTKGARLYVNGRIMYGEVTDRAGIRRHTTTIAVDDLIFLSSKK